MLSVLALKCAYILLYKYTCIFFLLSSFRGATRSIEREHTRYRVLLPLGDEWKWMCVFFYKFQTQISFFTSTINYSPKPGWLHQTWDLVHDVLSACTHWSWDKLQIHPGPDKVINEDEKINKFIQLFSALIIWPFLIPKQKFPAF